MKTDRIKNLYNKTRKMIVLASIIYIVVTLAKWYLPHVETWPNKELKISSAKYFFTNNYQNGAWVGIHNNKLYCYFEKNNNYMPNEWYKGYITIIDYMNPKRVYSPSSSHGPCQIVGSNNNLIYFLTNSNDQNETLFVFDLNTNEENDLLCGNIASIEEFKWDSNGSLFVPIYIEPDLNNYVYVKVNGKKVETQHYYDDLKIGLANCYYSIKSCPYLFSSVHKLYKSDINGSKTIKSIIRDANTAFLLPTDDAIYIYARGCKKALRKITLDQIIEDAVSLPDTIFSSVCMNDSFIYVSYAESNYAINKSSAEKGTYRYSLAEGTLEKVSSEYYYCMFVLDDLFIYAIKSSGRIDVLNCDGNIVETISLL